ncbi:hypothetical protein B296_00011609 [Ensete ventricosum]|uniref:Plastocyanin-like domain-containing protein n=1 Tax=Ensete ventricosum TaxID=4639 RepID=A0A427AR65_ENSVE|nr:hypothetical protein B296_00011609 [Ensete ventricosum]
MLTRCSCIRNDIQQRKNSWMDGMPGTNYPIPPGNNFTYHFQVKDQIRSFFYFPSMGMHKVADAFGGLRVNSRLLIPVPLADPTDDYTVLIGDWYAKSHKALAAILDAGHGIGNPVGVLINGRTSKDASGRDDAPLFIMEAGKTYRYRICNVGMKVSLNFRTQNHRMKLVEMDGSHCCLFCRTSGRRRRVEDTRNTFNQQSAVLWNKPRAPIYND